MHTPGVVGMTGAGNYVAPAMQQDGGGRKSKHTAKALKRVLKAHGLKCTGKKAALTRRAKKAHLLSKV
jgi:hypothetical protein